MRAIVLVAIAPLFTGCTATLLYEPRLQVSPYLAVNRLRGEVAVQSSPGGGAPPVDNAAQPLSTFGQDHHEDDLGIRADLGDGFGGLRLDYYRLDMNTTRAGVLEDDWGNLLQGDTVRMRAEMDELRFGYLEPLWETKASLRERPVDIKFAAGAVIAHRDMHMRSETTDGARNQTISISGDVAYAAIRGRAGWQNVAFDIDYAISPNLQLGGDWEGTQQDLELRASYTLPQRDVTFFTGWRYSDLRASGHQGAVGYDADLKLDGFQFGLTVTF